MNSNLKPNVFLIGAGPGDPELLTMKAFRLIQEAEVVVTDRLVSKGILDLIPKGVTLIDVGKRDGCHNMMQGEINETLVRLGKSKRKVVRLKGGDPYIFGRGSEEALHLIEQGVIFEIVPGITAAQGCGSLNGIPLTHRGLSTGVRFVTGHLKNDGELDLNWSSLACDQTTLVVYMGLGSIGKFAENLIKHGLPASTPVAAIEKGCSADQRRIIGPLNEIQNAVVEADFRPPTLFIIGRVVTLADQLDWQNTDFEMNDETITNDICASH